MFLASGLALYRPERLVGHERHVEVAGGLRFFFLGFDTQMNVIETECVAVICEQLASQPRSIPKP